MKSLQRNYFKEHIMIIFVFMADRPRGSSDIAYELVKLIYKIFYNLFTHLLNIKNSYNPSILCQTAFLV